MLRLGGGLRQLPRSVAIGFVAVVVFAAPVGAAVTPDGVTDPSTPEVTNPPPDTSSTSSTTTTTTTKPRKKPAVTKDGETIDPAVPTDDTPTAGPPELTKAGILLPDDSLAAAMQELGLERAKVDLIGRRRTELDTKILAHEAELKSVRRQVKREETQRLDRALATYRGQSSGWALGVIVERGLAQERALYLVAAADAAARGKIKSMQRRARGLVVQLEAERAERLSVGRQMDAAVLNVNVLLEKLAASSGTISLIDGETVYVPTGPSRVALLADAADLELSRLILTQQPHATDQRWLTARDALATEIARGKGFGDASATALEQEWEATAPNVLHATLFALRQVGKEYVYATAGPRTFDCSGLTKAAYAQIGLGLPHFSGAQLRVGVPVTPETLRPGDLLAYGPDGSGHVTMYIGDGLAVAARGRAYGVVVTEARVDPTKGFAGATRIVP